MPKFRKKPIVVEAEQWLGPESLGKVAGVREAFMMLMPEHIAGPPPYFVIDTLEGTVRVRPGDWIITGVKDEKYSCRKDIFEETYEPAPSAEKEKRSEPAMAYLSLLEAAWRIITTINHGRGGGEWHKQGREWEQVVWRWRDDYHALLRREREHGGPHQLESSIDVVPVEHVRERFEELEKRIEAVEKDAGLRVEPFARKQVGPTTVVGFDVKATIATEGFARVSDGDERALLDAARNASSPRASFLEMPKIVCLCGSTRFTKAFVDALLAETLKGNIVLTVGGTTHSDAEVLVGTICKLPAGGRYEDFPLSEVRHPDATPGGSHTCQMLPLTHPAHAATKKALDELHFKKIELADEILILNCRRCTKCGVTDGGRLEWEGKTLGSLECAYPTVGVSHNFEPYIGESTKREFAHAMKLGKMVRFLNPMSDEQRLKLLDETRAEREAE